MIDLFLVRHGPTHAHGMVGWTDLPADLSDLPAIERLRAHLPADAPVISSDLLRASATADALAGGRRRLPHDPALREMHFGGWELQSHADLQRSDPERARAFRQDPTGVRPPGGETWSEACARMDGAIDRLARAHAGGAVIVVAHFGVVLSQLRRATHLPEDSLFAHRIDPLSVTELRWTGRAWQAVAVNHVP
ncbi:histidine phosphatase family protein [Aquicoccus sp. SCR17]|nr:histidine phosphatase family protein [Carideicomes alvinocaridis]